MTTFAVTSTDQNQIVDAVNYAISNIGQGNAADGLTVNENTGEITAPNGDIVAYLFQWINIRYADSADGSVNFSTSPTNRQYFGVRNSQTSAASSNPADYVWTQVAGGFGTTKFLYYTVYGGRGIIFDADTVNPGTGYLQTQDGVAINLDLITASTTQQIAQINIYQRATSAPATPTGGTYNFSTLVLTAPTGWYSSVPNGTDPIWISTNTFEADPNTVSVGPIGAWSTPALQAESGTSTFTVIAYADSTSVPATPTGGTWDFSTGTGTPPTGNVTWALTPSTPSGNLYTSQSIASILGSSGVANLVTWSTPVEFGAAPGTDGVSVFYYSVFIASATQPATPGASGSYNFGTLVGTPPTGWSNFPPSTAPGQEIWVVSAQAAASTPAGIWTAGVSSWSTPVQYNGTAGTNALIVVPTYSNGFIFSRNNANVWTPTPAGNLITSTANVVASRGSNVVGFVNQIVNYNIVTGAWTTTQGANLNPGNFTIGTPNTSNTNYFNTILYGDSAGNSATNVQFAIVEGGVNGNAGPAGSRGFIPLAYIQTPTNPVTASTAQLTSWFSALRTNTTPPIGISPDSGNIYTPIPGDTANFNDPTTGIQITKTYDGTTWNNVTGEVINGNLLVLGTVTSNKLNANDIYAINIQSTGANLGNASSTGYWLQASTGNARFAGSVSIGNNLTVGNIITNSALASNSVPEAAIQSGAVTNSKLGALSVDSVKLAANAVTAGKISANAVTAGTVAANVIGADQIVAGAVTAGKIGANAVTANTIAAGSITTDKLAANLIISQDIQSTGATVGNFSSPGYWLQGSTGNARFGGTVSIGNNLTVGNLITASSLNANTVSATNLVPGTIPAGAAGTVTAFADVNLTTTGAYDWTYTGGTTRGYWKTLARIDIPVTQALALLTSAAAQEYSIVFSCNITGSGLQGGSVGPGFFIFTNYEATPASETYGGSGIPIYVPSNSTPVYPGADNTPGSLITPQFGRNLTTGAFPQTYSGAFQVSGRTQIPSFAGQAVLGSTITIGVGVLNDRNTTPSGNIGNLSITSISFNVTPTD